MKLMKKIAAVALCHRAIHALIAALYGAGWAHLIDHTAQAAAVAVAYLVLALRG